jgi:lysophospholipase L1-like esterase
MRVQFGQLIGLEDRVRALVTTRLAEGGFAVVDTTPDFTRELASGVMLFHETDDTHPNATGYGVIARAISRQIGDARYRSRLPQ